MDLTNRQFDNLSAEWLFHNVAYACYIERDSAIDAELEYNGDGRWFVRAITKTLEILGWD